METRMIDDIEDYEYEQSREQDMSFPEQTIRCHLCGSRVTVFADVYGYRFVECTVCGWNFKEPDDGGIL